VCLEPERDVLAVPVVHPLRQHVHGVLANHFAFLNACALMSEEKLNLKMKCNRLLKKETQTIKQHQSLRRIIPARPAKISSKSSIAPIAAQPLSLLLAKSIPLRT
jgi:hypothetical protein